MTSYLVGMEIEGSHDPGCGEMGWQSLAWAGVKVEAECMRRMCMDVYASVCTDASNGMEEGGRRWW